MSHLLIDSDGRVRQWLSRPVVPELAVGEILVEAFGIDRAFAKNYYWSGSALIEKGASAVQASAGPFVVGDSVTFDGISPDTIVGVEAPEDTGRRIEHGPTMTQPLASAGTWIFTFDALRQRRHTIAITVEPAP